MYAPFAKITYILSLHSASLEQFLRAVWDAVSQAAILILSQIKFNSEFSSCPFFFFFKSTLMVRINTPIEIVGEILKWLQKVLQLIMDFNYPQYTNPFTKSSVEGKKKGTRKRVGWGRKKGR